MNFKHADKFEKGVWLTIDPGVNTCIALWKNASLLTTATFKSDMRESTWRVHDYFRWVCKYIANQSAYFLPSGVLIEATEFYQLSLKSRTAGVSGDLSLLAYITGAIIGACGPIITQTYLISPRDWKGQLPYPQLRKILKDKFNIEAKNDHEAAAIGMGLWAKGEL